MLRRQLGLLLFFCFALFCAPSAQEERGVAKIRPVSETAESAFLRSSPGKNLELKLNEDNMVDASLVEADGAVVVFIKKNYLDCLVPVDSYFLENGFPGSFTNLDRYYDLKLQTEPGEVKVYELSRSSDAKDRKKFLGNTKRGGLRLDRSQYYNSFSGSFSQVELSIEQDGYEPFQIKLSAKELVPGKVLEPIRLEANTLWGKAKQSYAIMLVALVLPVVTVALIFFSWRARKAAEPTQTRDDYIGSYQKLELVGRGGTAEVYRCLAEDGLEVALKVMLENPTDEDSEERFRREVQASLSLKHPNLAAIYDWGQTEDGRFFLASEFLRGETLAERLQKESVGPERDQLISSALSGIAEALYYLHEQGVVHRDVKPTNIFLAKEGAKLIDLGLARGGDLDELTKTGLVMGSPYYISPEQATGKFTARSDQYALGIIAFEIVTGERPFTGSDALELLQKHNTAPIPSISEYREDFSLHMASAIMRMLSKRPEQRFDNVKEAVATLVLEMENPLDEGTQAVEV